MAEPTLRQGVHALPTRATAQETGALVIAALIFTSPICYPHFQFHTYIPCYQFPSFSSLSLLSLPTYFLCTPLALEGAPVPPNVTHDCARSSVEWAKRELDRGELEATHRVEVEIAAAVRG